MVKVLHNPIFEIWLISKVHKELMKLDTKNRHKKPKKTNSSIEKWGTELNRFPKRRISNTQEAIKEMFKVLKNLVNVN